MDVCDDGSELERDLSDGPSAVHSRLDNGESGAYSRYGRGIPMVLTCVLFKPMILLTLKVSVKSAILLWIVDPLKRAIAKQYFT